MRAVRPAILYGRYVLCCLGESEIGIYNGQRHPYNRDPYSILFLNKASF